MATDAIDGAGVTAHPAMGDRHLAQHGQRQFRQIGLAMYTYIGEVGGSLRTSLPSSMIPTEANGYIGGNTTGFSDSNMDADIAALRRSWTRNGKSRFPPTCTVFMPNSFRRCRCFSEPRPPLCRRGCMATR